MDLAEFCRELQFVETLDDASLRSHTALVLALCKLIDKAAQERLGPDDEPSDYIRIVLDRRS